MRTWSALLLVTAWSSFSSAENWPAFRGTGDSITNDGKYPLEWSPKKGIAWSVETPGFGQSSPIVWNGTVYLTAVEGDDRQKGYIVALDAATGKERWRHTFEPTQKAKWSNYISRGAPTPCADADGVYAFFEGGNLISLTHDGKRRWERSLVKEYGEFKGGHGIGTSPVQNADTLFLFLDQPGPSYVLAIEKATGKTRWKTDREGKQSWTSPILATQAGRPILLASSNGQVAAFAVDSGKELWNLTGFTGNTLPSATVAGDLVVVGAGTGRGAKPGADAKSTCCLTLTTKDGKPGYTLKWEGKPGISSYASPLVYDGVAYFVNQVGVVYGYDLKSGKELFDERIAAPCWATPVAAGKHVYLFGKDGTTTVLKPGKEFEILAENRLWDEAKASGEEESGPTVTGVAAANGAFYVRIGSKLFKVAD